MTRIATGAARAAETVQRADAVARSLRAIPFLSGLPERSMAGLASAARLASAKLGSILFHEGDAATSAIVVVSGLLKIYVVLPNGRSKTLALLIEGEAWDEGCLASPSIRSGTCQVLAEGSVLWIERSKFEATLRASPEIAIALVRSLADRLRRVHQEAIALALEQSDARLARFLLDLADRRDLKRGTGAPGCGIKIDLPIAQREIADFLGVRREVVTRTFTKLRRAGVIENRGRQIIVQDIAALEDLAFP